MFILKPTSISFSIALLAIAIVFSSASRVAPSYAPSVSPNPNPINPFCINSLHKEKCAKVVKDATTWVNAMFNALNTTLDFVKSKKFIAYSVGSKLPENAPGWGAVDTMCKGRYEDLVEYVQMCIDDMNEKRYNELESHTSYDSITYSDCPLTMGDYNLGEPDANYFKYEVQVFGEIIRGIWEMIPCSLIIKTKYCYHA